MNNNIYSLHPIIVQGNYHQQPGPNQDGSRNGQPSVAIADSQGARVPPQTIAMQAVAQSPNGSQYVQIQQVQQRPVQFLQPSVIYPQQVQYQPQGGDGGRQPISTQIAYPQAYAPPNVQFVQIVPGANNSRIFMPMQSYRGQGQNMQHLTYLHPTQIVPQQVVQLQPAQPNSPSSSRMSPRLTASSSPMEPRVQEIETVEPKRSISPRITVVKEKSSPRISVVREKTPQKQQAGMTFDKDMYETKEKAPVKTGKLRVVFRLFRLLRRRNQEANQAEAFYMVELHGVPDSTNEADMAEMMRPQTVSFEFSVGNSKTGRRRLVSEEVKKVFVSFPKLRNASEKQSLSLKSRRISGIIAFKNLDMFEQVEASFVVHVTMSCKCKYLKGVSPEIHFAKKTSFASLVAPPDVSIKLPTDMWRPSKAATLVVSKGVLGATPGPTNQGSIVSASAGKRAREKEVIDLTGSAKRPKLSTKKSSSKASSLSLAPKMSSARGKIDGEDCWCAKITITGDLSKIEAPTLPVRINIVGSDAIALALPDEEPCTIDVARCTAFVLFRLFRRLPVSANDPRKFRVYFDLGQLEGGVMSREMNVSDTRIKNVKSQDLSVDLVEGVLEQLEMLPDQLASELALNSKDLEDWLSGKDRAEPRLKEVNQALVSWVHLYPDLSELVRKKLRKNDREGGSSPEKNRDEAKAVEPRETYLKSTTLGSMPFSELEVRVKVLYAKNALGYTFEQIVDGLNLDVAEPRSLMENWVIYDGNRCGHPGLTDVLNNWYDEQLSSGKLLPFETRPDGLEDLFSTTIYKARRSNSSGQFYIKDCDFTEVERIKMKAMLNSGPKPRKVSPDSSSSKTKENQATFPSMSGLMRADKSAGRIKNLLKKSNYDETKGDVDSAVEASIVLLQWMKPLQAKRRPGRPKGNTVVYSWEGKGKSRRPGSKKTGSEARVSMENVDKVPDNQIRKQIFPLLKLKGLTYNLVARELGVSNVVSLRKWVQGECLEDSRVSACGKKLRKWFWKERYAVVSSLASPEREFIERPPDEDVLFEKHATRRVSKQQGLGAVGSGLNDDCLTNGRKQGIARTMPIPLPSDVSKALVTLSNMNQASVAIVGKQP